uniref:Uncharacterized protein n=1 Tax=viral metagenome TaxID=1070528 RepID=A0A6M3JNM6_9ZZZZ
MELIRYSINEAEIKKLLVFADKIQDLTANNLNLKSKKARILYGETIGAIQAVEATLRLEIKGL